LPNPALKPTAKVALASVDADGVKAPKNVYPETNKVQLEILPIVPNGSSKHVSAQHALNTRTANLAQTTLFVDGALTATNAVRLTLMALSMATVTI
jgi:hypothetical protein